MSLSSHYSSPELRSPLKKVTPTSEARKYTLTPLDAPTATPREQPKEPADIALIDTALNQHFIFTNLSAENRVMVIEEMKLYSVDAHQIVFEQNQPGQKFFIIAEGTVEVLVNNKFVKELPKGESFGELALLHGSLRSATIRTLTSTSL